jgi:hypothetical protein
MNLQLFKEKIISSEQLKNITAPLPPEDDKDIFSKILFSNVKLPLEELEKKLKIPPDISKFE